MDLRLIADILSKEKIVVSTARCDRGAEDAKVVFMLFPVRGRKTKKTDLFEKRKNHKLPKFFHPSGLQFIVFRPLSGKR